MLTRLSSAISTAILGTGVIVAVGATPASASCGTFCKRAHVGTTRTIPGSSGRQGGGGGKAGPPPCPPNTNCNTIGAGTAAPAAPPRTIDLAYDAYANLELPAPHLHTSPANKTYVQLRTGLWLNPADFKEEKVTAPPAGGQTVAVIGEPKSVTWNMGESTVTCDSAGSRQGTKCGYTYQRSSAGQPNGKYAISVTVTWDVRWTCAGIQCEARNGTFPGQPTGSMTSNATLAVGEVQTESRPN